MGCYKMEERLTYRDSGRYYQYKTTDLIPIFGPLFYMRRLIAGAEDLSGINEILQEVIPRAGILIAYNKCLEIIVEKALT